MESMVFTLGPVKPERSTLSMWAYSNMLDMSCTLEVSKLDRSRLSAVHL